MSLEKETKNKIVDGAMVAAKMTGYMGVNALAICLGGSMGARTGRAIVPRPINMWKNQRRTRAFRDALEEAGTSLDFGVRVTFHGKQPKVSSLTWAAMNIGCDKWELAYFLAKNGACSFDGGRTKAEIVR